jgi:hypothetical protein
MMISDGHKDERDVWKYYYKLKSTLRDCRLRTRELLEARKFFSPAEAAAAQALIERALWGAPDAQALPASERSAGALG